MGGGLDFDVVLVEGLSGRVERQQCEDQRTTIETTYFMHSGDASVVTSSMLFNSDRSTPYCQKFENEKRRAREVAMLRALRYYPGYRGLSVHSRHKS